MPKAETSDADILDPDSGEITAPWGPSAFPGTAGPSGTLADQALGLIYEEIVSGRMVPGERLMPDKLRERFQLGASPIREALMRLSAVGLVLGEGHRGFRVATVSEAELADIADVRAELCCMALARSIELGDHEWEGTIIATFHMMERIKQATIDDPERYFPLWEQRNKAFHTALEAGCRSPWLLHFCSVAFSQSERYRRYFAQYPTIIPEAQEEHRVIMEASVARDKKTAVAMLRQHIARNMEIVRAAMREGKPRGAKAKRGKRRKTAS